MNNYIKSVIFTLVLAVSVYEITCGVGPQGTTIIYNQKGASSATLIQQESNLPPNVPHGQNTPQSYPAQPQKTDPVNSAPNRGGSRDYVNPNIPQSTTKPNAQNIPLSTTVSTININRGGLRDYVNPHKPPTTSNPQNIPTSQNIQNRGNSRDYTPTIQIGSNRGAVRDYVNPSNPAGTPTGSINPTQQFRPSPRNANPGRDYVNPNFNPGNNQKPIRGVAGGVLNSPQNSDFPTLPTRNNLHSNQNIPSATPISYASKVSGGVTTKAPTGQRPSIPGPSTTTEKSESGPTDAELKDFSEALLRRDVNNAAKYLTINVQGKTTSGSKNDEAPDKLLVAEPDAYQISTISKLKLLHNNYILDTSENEFVTPQEKSEENDLLDTMLTTPIMQYTKNFLVSRGKLSQDPKEFKSLLKTLWFNLYSRGKGKIGSSGFEHIFLAELKNSEVSGLHNWVYFDQAEMSKIVDYLGYMKKLDLGEKGAILKFHFKLNGVDKPVGSMFIGTSPELEMALYTTCYVFRANKICPLRLNGKNFIIRTFNIRYRGKNMIGSAFPEI